ncbi:MAG: hypothetical protein Q9M92_08150 [Enterobacterales bacterium]|nr:hypothetical protein [Enterobacterales bacterium]
MFDLKITHRILSKHFAHVWAKSDLNTSNQYLLMPLAPVPVFPFTFISHYRHYRPIDVEANFIGCNWLDQRKEFRGSLLFEKVE